MLSLSTATLEKIAAKSKDRRYEVSFRKRFWDIEVQAYTLLGSFEKLPRDEIKAIGASRDALDSSSINEFKSSNITLELNNKDNEWSQQNPLGKFKKTATARQGFESQLMEFKVEMFYKLEDGTESAAIPMFVGRASQYNFNPNKKTVSITVKSKHVLLERGKAENVSVSVTNELLVGTIDGVNTVFNTALVGVGRILETRRNTIVQRPGSDITITNLSKFDQPATITFATAPIGGDDLRVDYIQWLQNQKIDDLVKLLAAEVGFTPAQLAVEPVVFENLVLNTKRFTSKADWDGGLNLTNIDTASTPGEIKRAWWLFDDFSDLNLTAPPVNWSHTPSGNATASAATGSLVQTAGPDGTQNPTIDWSATYFSGIPTSVATWGWNWDVAPQVPIRVIITPRIMALFMPFATANNGQGYGLELEQVSGTETLFFVRRDSFLAKANLINLGAWVLGNHDWRISRDSSGEFKIYRDGTLLGTVTDNTYTVFTRLHGRTGADSGVLVTTSIIDDVHYSLTVGVTEAPFSDLQAVWESDPIDGTDDLGEWLDSITTKITPAGTSVLTETATADESFPGSGVPGPFDPFVAVSLNNKVLSVKRRFLKVRATFTSVLPPSAIATASVQDITITFRTSTTTIRMANFTNLRVFDAIKALGDTANYEWGISRTGILFFRPRRFVTTPDLIIKLKDVREFTRISDGTDRVFNEILATYGTHDRLVNPITQKDPSPNSFDRFGVSRLPVGSSQLLVDPDADIASGVAVSYYNLFKFPRRRLELTIDLAPQLELADTILLRISDELPSPPWYVGDTSRSIGLQTIHLYGECQQSAYGFLARILSVSHDSIRMLTRLELEEII